MFHTSLFIDEMKESMVAKVCAQCEELYTDVVRALQRDSRQWFDRDWLLTVSDLLTRTPVHTALASL